MIATEMASGSTAQHADKLQMQHRLFSELSSMFGREVPLYDKALLVNRVCNRAACDLLGAKYRGFAISDEQLEKTSGERHGAIRIGTAEEYRWIGRFFAAFAMEPHNFYDMTSVGAKSQPIIATAFRSRHAPEHRVFTSLLQTSWFDDETRRRIEELLATRRVFSDAAKTIIEKGERDGGLSWRDADALIREAVERIFKWTGRARGHALYRDLCAANFKIAADIACFESHHLNHLTPNTLCMEVYTTAMKFCLGELDEAQLRSRCGRALAALLDAADSDWMHLHFKHLSFDQIESFEHLDGAKTCVGDVVSGLASRLQQDDLQLADLDHAGFKDTTEGPSADTPVLLRQDSYKALTEPVVFLEADGSVIKATHTARFGEIEQRFYATTPAGRELYDRCLSAAEAAIEADPGLAQRDYAAYQIRHAKAFAPFPKTLKELVEQGLVYAAFKPTAKGLAAKGQLPTADPLELVRLGYARLEGLRYEDFLPVSAAGIFASNLSQYGTKSTAAQRPRFTQAMLEEVLGRPIVDSDNGYKAVAVESLAALYGALGVAPAGAARARPYATQ